MVVQGITECVLKTYNMEGKSYDVYTLKVKLLDNDNQPSVDYEVRVTPECVEKYKLLDKKQFAQTFYQAPIAKLIGEIQYNPYQRKEKKIIHDIDLKVTSQSSQPSQEQKKVDVNK